MRVVFANIPCLCYIIQWKRKISWKKLQIALKEANETSYWLLLLGKTNILSSAEYDRLETFLPGNQNNSDRLNQHHERES